MDCTEFQSIVAGEREDDLTAFESDAFEAHLESCGACRETFARAEEDLERLAHLADPPPLAASAWSRVDEAVRAQATRRPGREDPFAPDAARTVAAVLAPAMPVTLRPRAAQARRSRSLLVFAAVAAAVVIVFAYSFAPPVEHGIGRVNPPGEKDVVYKDVKLGPALKKLKEQGHLIHLGEGE